MKKLLVLLIVFVSCKGEEISLDRQFSCSVQLTNIVQSKAQHSMIDSLTIEQTNSLLKQKAFDYCLVGCTRTK